MTDRSKFEQMLEYLISEEQDKAKELFHQLVVEKSREIYETILSEDFEEDEEVDEAKEEDEEEVEEGMEVTFSETDDEEEDEMEMSMGNDEIGGDATDDFMGDIEAGDDMDDGDMDGEEGLEDRVVDIEDALDELKAEFEKMMAGEDGEESGDEEEADSEEDDEEVKDSFDVSDNFMREYIEKVANPKHGDNGVNTKSPMAGKNNMGGTSANIAQNYEATGEGTQGGLANPSTKEENFGNINVPGGNAGKTAFKKKEPGHGAEKKGTGDMGDKSAGSPINGVKSRAK